MNRSQRLNTVLSFKKAIDADALAFYNRGIADGAVCPCGFKEINDTIKLLKAAMPNFMSLGKSFVVPHWMVKEATGTGATAGNRAVSKLYNFFGASGDQIQSTASAQFLLLKHIGVNYLYLPGTAGNYVTTPSASGNDLTGNFGIETYINPTNLTGSKTIEGKYSGSNATSQQIFYLSGNTLKLDVYQSTAGTTYTSNAVPFAANVAFYARVSRNSTTGTIKFFTSSDGLSWTQLGADISGITGALNSPNRILEIGSIISGASNVFTGLIYYVKLYKDDTFTTVTQSFEPQYYNHSVSQTTLQKDVNSEIYTINFNTSVFTGTKAFICYKTVVMLNGSSMGMQASGLAFDTDKITHFAVFKKFNNSVTSIHSAIGNNAGGAAGYYLALNEGSNNTEGVGCYANVFNGRNYTSNSTLAKITIAYADTALTNPETDYYINNVQASPVSQTGTGNNTGNIVATGYNLGASNNAGSLWSNEVIYADFISTGIMNESTRLAVYNVFKTYFNL